MCCQNLHFSFRILLFLSPFCNKINKWLLKFPANEKKPAIIFGLHQIQKESKYIQSAHVDALAKFLNVEKIDVYELQPFTQCLN